MLQQATQDAHEGITRMFMQQWPSFVIPCKGFGHGARHVGIFWSMPEVMRGIANNELFLILVIQLSHYCRMHTCLEAIVRSVGRCSCAINRVGEPC